jgi:mannan endo-1,4-beta-mannosidase
VRQTGFFDIFNTWNHNISIMKQKFTRISFLLMLMFCSGQVSAQKYEAENAQLSGGATVVNSSEASGSRYVQMREGNMTFNVETPTTGMYTLDIIFSQTYDDTKTQNLSVNGSAVGSITFPETTDFTPTQIVVKLLAGPNTIQITKSWGWVDIDYIEIAPFQKTIFSVDASPVISQPSEAAVELYEFLRENFQQKTISGVMTGVVLSGNNPLPLESQQEVAFIKTSSGKYPALVGFDFMHSTGKNSEGVWFRAYTDAVMSMAEELWEAGGIPAFCWHWKDPLRNEEAFYTPGSGSSSTNFDLTTAFTDATCSVWNTNSDAYKAIISDIDFVSGLLKELQDKGIAVLWRPIHEASGGWFWWGRDKKAAPFVSLYKLMFDRMVNVNGLKNLIWVWNSEGGTDAEWYPGDEYVDIIARDFYYYPREKNHSSLIGEFEKLKNVFGTKKIIALAENGSVPYPDDMKDDGADWSYFMPWYGDYVTQDNTASDWNLIMNNEYVITLEDMPGWSVENEPVPNPVLGKYEAEDAEYKGGIETMAGYSGTGCVNIKDADGYVRFTIPVEEKGSYKIYLGYGAKYGAKNLQVSVNSIAKSVSLPAGETECNELLVGEFSFKAGDNTVEVLPDWTWFLVDYIRIEEGEGGDDDVFPPADVDGFKVDGSKLLDANNNEFVMRGVNMAWTWYKQNGMAQLEAIARAKANTVRIVLSNGKQWTKDNAATVASLIQKCEELKMIAVLEVHDVTGSDLISDLEGAARYFAEIKNVLIGKESTVIINIANEWHNNSSAENWRDGYLSAISIIRDAGLRHNVMIDAGGYGQNAATIHSYGKALLAADPEHNLIFSIHMYGGAGNTNNVKRSIDGVINQDLALCIGEFGWYHSDGNVDEDLIISYCKEKNVGWLAWSWYGNGSPVEYLDMVTDPADETAVNSPVYEGVGCNWGEKIINAWVEEARTCSVFSETTNVKDINSDMRVMVYPTQIKDVVNVYCPAGNDYYVSVTDVPGRQVFKSLLKEEMTLISCSNWNNGIFFISVTGNNMTKTFKVIK